MSDVETLRQAAALMRQRATAATPGPWRFTDSEAVNDVWSGGMVVVNGDADPIANVQDEWYENDPDEPAPINDAEHIASWGPTVALAVADWLDSVRAPDDPHTLAEAESKRCRLCAEYHRALAVARAYLGRDS